MGCGEGTPRGPKRHQISGTVSLDGTPLKVGEILFLPEHGTTSLSGTSINDGKYLIHESKGLVAGLYKVSISSTELRPFPEGAPKDPMGDSMQAIELIPVRYNSETELTLEVKDDGSNSASYKLTSQ